MSQLTRSLMCDPGTPPGARTLTCGPPTGRAVMAKPQASPEDTAVTHPRPSLTLQATLPIQRPARSRSYNLPPLPPAPCIFPPRMSDSQLANMRTMLYNAFSTPVVRVLRGTTVAQKH